MITVDNNADSFLIQLSTWDIEELKEKLEKRVQQSKKNMEKMIFSLYKMLIRTNKLLKLLKTGGKYTTEFLITTIFVTDILKILIIILFDNFS